MLAPVNPTTGQKLAEVASLSAAEANNVIDKAVAAFPAWRDLSIARRDEYLKAVAAAMRERKDRLAELMA